ncbi:MAG: tetratricopeptide repeat protein [Acidobacteriota bacterium]
MMDSRTSRTTLSWVLLTLFLVGALASEASARNVRTRVVIDKAALQVSEEGQANDEQAVTGLSGWDELRRRLGQWRREVSAGNDSEANNLLPQMQRQLAEPGAKSKTLVVGSLVAMGHESLQLESPEDAEKAFEAALQLEPSYPPALLGRAELAMSRGDYVSAMTDVVKSVMANMSKTDGQVRLLSRAGLVLLLAGVIACAGYSMVLLVKHGRLFRFGLQEKLSGMLPDGLDAWVARAVLFLPVLLFLSPPWWAIFWLVALSGHGSRAKRVLAAACLLFLALVPPAFHALSWLTSLTEDPAYRAILGLESGDVLDSTLSDYERGLKARPKPDERFLKAALEAATGNASTALTSYGELIDDQPRHARAMINRANIHFRRGAISSAIADYQLATEKDRREALAWRNGSIAFTQQFQTDKAEEWRRKARQLAPNLVDEWRDRYGSDVMVDARLSPGEKKAIVKRSHGSLTGSLVGRLLNPTSIAALLGFFLVVMRLKKQGGFFDAVACEKCGRAFASLHSSGDTESSYCTQCVHLYVKKDGVSPEVRTAKLREVERHIAFSSIAVRTFNLLLPGTGGLYANRLVSGGLLLLLWSTALSALLLAPRMVSDPLRLSQLDVSIVFIIELAVLVLCYVIALVQSLRH